MPDRMISASAGAKEALEKELSSARALLQVQRELDEAVCTAASSDRLWALVRALETAAGEATQAARERARWFSGSGSVEAYLKDRPVSEVRAYRAILSEAKSLRAEMDRTARRTEYVARRTVEWSQAQMETMVNWISRQGSTYGAPGGRRPQSRTPSFMDRSA